MHVLNARMLDRKGPQMLVHYGPPHLRMSLIRLFASVGLSDARNPLKALQRLRQDPDSTEFVYLRPFRVDETMPINPYHLEIVSHAEIDEVKVPAG